MDLGVDFRATSGFVTDPGGSTFDIGEVYPITRGGGTFGWTTGGAAGSRDRSTGVDARLAGLNQGANTGTNQQIWRFDLPAAGSYNIYLAIGDATNAQGYQHAEIRDNGTTKVTIDQSAGTGATQWYDASNVLRTSSADWVSNEQPVTVTFSSTILEVLVGTSTSQAGSSTIAHVRIVSLGMTDEDYPPDLPRPWPDALVTVW